MASKISMKTILKRIKKESKPIIEAAMRSGANNIGKEFLNAADNVNQTPDPLIKKLATAVKSGVLAAGEEMMMAGMDRVKAFSSDNQSDTPSDNPSKESEQSTPKS